MSRLSIVRTIFAVINKLDLDAYQMDVKTAFLYGEVQEDIYMPIPEGYEYDREFRENHVCKLVRAIYGLKRSPKIWNDRFTKAVLELGLEQDISEPCLFTWRRENKLVLLLFYVDDILVAGNSKPKMEEIKAKLMLQFQIKVIPEPVRFVGIELSRDRENKVLSLKQPTYIRNCLERFEMLETKPKSTPMITRQVKNREIRDRETEITSEKTKSEPKAPYREAIGSLLYLASATRPDISFAVSYLSRKQLNPSLDDWVDVKRIFRYLRGTMELGLTFRAESKSLEASTDASFRDCEESHSTGGYVIKLFGDTVAWRSHKQSYVTLSTCQAEYLAMSDACQELVSLDKAIRDMLGKTMFPVTIWCDNKSARDCTQMEGNHRLKNFDDDLETIKFKLLERERERTGTKCHMGETHGDYIKLCVKLGKVEVKWIASSENEADMMTKPLTLKAHTALRDKILNFRDPNLTS